MENIAEILGVLTICFYLVLALVLITTNVIEAVDRHHRDKQSELWEEEQHRLERERAAHDEEYHQKRMQQLDK